MRYEITTDDEFKRLVEQLGETSSKFRKYMLLAMRKAVTHVRSEILGSGRVPFKTGTLRRSITTRVNEGSGIGDLEGVVGTNLPYAAIHEYGGTFTRFAAFGRPTRPFSVTYKERKYLRQPFQEAQRAVHAIFVKAAEDAVSFRTN